MESEYTDQEREKIVERILALDNRKIITFLKTIGLSWGNNEKNIDQIRTDPDASSWAIIESPKKKVLQALKKVESG